MKSLADALVWYDNVTDDFIGTRVNIDALLGDVPPFYDNDSFLQMAYNDSLYLIEEYDLRRVVENYPNHVSCSEMKKASQCAASIIEVAMMNGNDETRRYLLRRIFDRAKYYLRETNKQEGRDIDDYKQEDQRKNTIKAVGDWFQYSIGNFIYLVSMVAARLGYDVKYFSEEDIPDKEWIDKFYKQSQQQEKQKTYETMPRNHRIAVVYRLLKAAGVNANNTDRTVMAGIVEAVTGGNIKTKPCDTLSYKRPEKTAENAADKWLEPIADIIGKSRR